MEGCNALYYPFSRCMDVTVLKQLLLLFDSITFLDPVDDDSWRGRLFKQVEREDERYAYYRELSDAMPWLRSEGVINVRSPHSLNSVDHKLTVAATLGDLADEEWVKAADPRQHQLPTQWFGGEPCWNVFRPKLPNDFVEALSDDPTLRRHLLQSGGDHYAWKLTYAAGSSVGINVHLAAADELSLAPVTDSRLHHYLILRKLQRSSQHVAPNRLDEVASIVAKRTVFNIIQAILPKSRLELLSLDDIMRFRVETAEYRREFLFDVYGIVAGEVDPTRPAYSEQVVHRVTQRLTEGRERTARLWMGRGKTYGPNYLVSPLHLYQRPRPLPPHWRLHL